MKIRGKDGRMVIERPDYEGYGFSSEEIAENEARYNKKYGVDGWRYAERICSHLCESCGCGESLSRETCRYCDGVCIRPVCR